ncbi:uncharacterized protein JCM10292_006239 [Rhodotorula paludigena]|uniref:uncharacterized protein n=1 Tax=Rhodotorula paludigena TaxID=86838 RepID=UPI00317DC88B
MAELMQEVSPGLWIGDYGAASDHALLEKHNIASIVSAMRQEYATASGVDLHRVSIDDTDKTNILEHFVPTADYIDGALQKGQNVLVHCQAGVSRSTTLVAAYLMRKHGLNVEQAVERIRAVRAQVEPSEAFMAQLEIFERCECEWDPVKWPEERRFLMSFAQTQIMEGASPSIVLAYYPSPATTPKDRADAAGLTMSSLPSEQISPPASPQPLRSSADSMPAVVSAPSTSEHPSPLPPAAPLPDLSAPPMRKRLTPRKDPVEDIKERKAEKAEIEKIGTKEQVVVSGRRIRCKMCRRELAAREHIVAHEPGKGQQAFAPNRRDMAAYREEMEKKRMDEAREAAAARAPAVAARPVAAEQEPPAASQPPTNPLAALRISQPPGGMRVSQPRGPPVLRPQPVARPPPRQTAPTLAESDGDSSAEPAAPAEEDASLFPAGTNNDPAAAPVPPSGSPAARMSPDSAAARRALVHDPPLLPSHTCSSYFVEPLSWMSPVLETGVLAGKIVCPNKKCGAKLGNFDWAGNQCSCGAWVCPGFALNVSRVDEVTG